RRGVQLSIAEGALDPAVGQPSKRKARLSQLHRARKDLGRFQFGFEPEGAGSGVAALAAIGLVVSVPKRIRYGMKGVTSKGIFSRSATVPTGLLLMSSSLSFQGSSFTRPPSGRAAIFCGLVLGSAAALPFRSEITGTRFPK